MKVQASSMVHNVEEKAGMSPQMSQLDAMMRSHDNLHYALGVIAHLVLVLR